MALSLPSLSLGLALGLSLTALTAHSRQDTVDVLQARELRLVDGAGNVRWIAGVTAGGEAFLELSNASGTPVAFLGSSDGDGALDLLNASGQRTVFAGASPAGDGGVRTENRDGTRAFYQGDDVRGNARVPASALPGARLRP